MMKRRRRAGPGNTRAMLAAAATVAIMCVPTTASAVAPTQVDDDPISTDVGETPLIGPIATLMDGCCETAAATCTTSSSVWSSMVQRATTQQTSMPACLTDCGEEEAPAPDQPPNPDVTQNGEDPDGAAGQEEATVDRKGVGLTNWWDGCTCTTGADRVGPHEYG